MQKKTLYIISVFSRFIGWLSLLFLQHLICFDIFDSNLWYLYVLAILCGITQFCVLFKHANIGKYKNIYQICYAIYYIVITLKFLQLVYFAMLQWYPTALDVLCLLMDILGAVLIAVRFRKIDKHK